jgi:hypothetical protein
MEGPVTGEIKILEQTLKEELTNVNMYRFNRAQNKNQ